MSSKKVNDKKEEIIQEIERIKKLSDDKLNEEIKNVNEAQLKQIGLMAYAEIFNRVVYLDAMIEEKDNLIEKVSKEESKFKEMKELFSKDILKLECLKIEEKENKEDIESFKEIRKEIVKLLRGLTSYATEISYANEITKDKAYLKFIKDNFSEVEENMNLDRLVESVKVFLTEDSINIKNKVMDITSVIPVKVSKIKYYELLENAFKKTMREAGKELIDIIMQRYKSIFDGRFVSEYGVYFDRYFMEAEKANKFNYKTDDEKLLSELYNETTEYLDEITFIANIVREFGIITNRIIAINILRKYILTGIDDKGIKILKENWNGYQENPKKFRVGLMKNFKKVFSSLDKEFQENNKKLQELTMENFRRGNKVDEKLKESLNKSQYVLSYINDYNLEEEEIKEMVNYVPAGEIYLNKSIQDLIEYIDRNSKDMQNIQRKVRMKRVISFVDGAFQTPEEFFNYLANSLSMTNNKEEQIAVANNILEIINRYKKRSNKDKES